MRTIRITEEVWDEIAKRGKFGETPDDVLRRVFNVSQKPSGKGARMKRQRYATRRMTSTIANGELMVKFEGDPERKWKLPSRDDKAAIARITEDAIGFAVDNDASQGQMNAVRKTLTDNGYHLTK